MTNEQLIKAWKNPELRGKLHNINHPSGSSFTELSEREMMEIQGSGDVQPETTPVCGFFVGLGAGVVITALAHC